MRSNALYVPRTGVSAAIDREYFQHPRIIAPRMRPGPILGRPSVLTTFRTCGIGAVFTKISYNFGGF
jgi:hypothetical protein